MRRPLLPLLCALALSGCAEFDAFKYLAESVQGLISGTDNADPPKELVPLEAPRVRLNVLWNVTVGDGYADQVVNLVPAVTEDKVYAADRKGLVMALNRLTGEKLWTVETGLTLSSGPAVADGKLFLGSSDGELLALNALDGETAWKSSLTSELLALPKVEDGTLVIRTSDGRVTALDAKTGADRWIHERTVPPLSVRSLGSPTVVGDLVLDGFGGGKLVALGLADGKPAWEATVAIPHGRSEVERLVEMDADAYVQGDTAYVSGYQAGVAAVNLKDGEVLWRQEHVYTSHGMAGDRRGLFLTDVNSDVWELDIRSGNDLWKQADLHMRRLTVPALIKNQLLVGDFEGYLHALSQEDGGLAGRVQIDDEAIRAQPVVYDDVAYVYSSGGVLAAVSVE
jgi:outer membrane protein assembly factor BamB